MNKIIILCLLSLSLSTQAQFVANEAPTDFELKLNNTKDISTLLKMSTAAKTNKNYQQLEKIIEKVVEIKPHFPMLKYQLAEAYALNDDKTKAFNTLIQLQKQGYYFNIQDNENFTNINSFPVFEYIKGNFDANGSHFGEGKESFNINKSFSGLLYENIAFDDNSQSFLMGSLRDGSVIKVASNGETTTLVAAAKGGREGPWAAIDLTVDNNNDILWVASSAITQFGKITKEAVGRAGIFKYQLSTGKFIKSYLMPENKRPSMIASMHLSPQGDLFFIGSQKNVVLKLAKDSEQISLVFTTKKYKSLHSITGDDTGKILYVSDGEAGIIIINVDNQQIYTLENTPSLNLTGISDLVYDDNGLIMIQNGNKPERIMRLALGKKKLGLKNIFPIESANPLFNSPSYGVVVAGGFYYIANSQIPKTNSYGGLLQGQKWEDMVILSSPKHYKEKETLAYQKKIADQKKKTGSEDKL